ncbi:ATP-grasp domain-containing protein, partial [Sporolactobacillus inulinus]
HYPYNKLTLSLLNDKLKMREFLASKQFEYVQSKKIKSFEDIVNFKKNINQNFIIKPVNGEGSKSIIKVTSKTDCKVIYEEMVTKYPNQQYFLEEYLEGLEYSVESYSENGAHKIFGITEKSKDENFIESRHIVPAPLSLELTNTIIKYVKSFLDTISFSEGPAHTEVIVTDKGPRIVESQPRVGGDMITDLYKTISNNNILEKILFGLLGKKVLNDIPVILYPYSRYAAVGFISPQQGLVKKISIDENGFKKNKVYDYKIFVTEGQYSSGQKDSFGRLAQVLVTGDSYDEVKKNVDSAIKNIVITLEK